MAKFLLAILVLVSLSLPAAAEESLGLKVAGNLLLLADWKQSRYIARHPEYWEKNPVIGKQPSVRRVDAYFATAIIAINLADYLIEDDVLSDGLWIGVTVIESHAVSNNIGIGIKFSF